MSNNSELPLFSSMASESIITLYDAASAKGKPLAWNTVTLRARYALNYKGVPYKTVWLEYPDLEATLRSIGAEPTSTRPDGSPYYTMPTIVDPSRRTPSGGPTVISDSWKIAEYLDKAYPSPGLLIPEGTKALQVLYSEHVTKTLFYPLAPIVVPAMHDILNEASRPYWRVTREAWLGAKLEEACPKGTKKWDDQWAIVQKGFSDTAVLLDKIGNEGGHPSLLLGNKVTHGDFMIAGILETLFLICPDEWESKVKEWDNGRWEKLRDYCAGWRSVH